MKKTIPFVEPAEGFFQRPFDRTTADKAVEEFRNGDTLASLHTILDAFNPDIRKRYGNPDGTRFHIPHGSIVVDISVADDRLTVHADFLNLPAKGRVAMLRQIAEMNIRRLMLARFVKQGERLGMEYSCRISESHPHKLYGVLRNICSIGDRYDDEFCSKFGAIRCYTPEIRPYSDETVDHIRESILKIGKAVLEAVGEQNSMRRYGYSWNLLLTAFYRIAFFANPQGQLVNDLQAAINALDDEIPVEELVSRASGYLESLMKKSREELAADLYHVDMMMSLKDDFTLQQLQEAVEDIHEEATKAMQGKDFDRVAVRVSMKLYEMLYYTNLPEDITAMIVKALRDSSDIEVEKAAGILWEAVDNIMEGEIPVSVPDIDPARIAAAAGEMQRKIAETVASDGLQEIQQRMAEAMGRGDMAEYMRLANEMQQKVLGGMFNL